MVGNRKVRLHDGDKVNFVRPSVDVAMQSMIATARDRIVGIVLTGMGADGAAGIAHIKRIGGTTIAQDERTSIVYGMPKAAFDTGCVDLVLPPEQIREKLVALFPA